MKLSRVMQLGIAAVICLFIHAPGARAQANEGRFTGSVVDPSGSAVPGATVAIKNERTGEARTVTSNAQGRYLVAGLKPSTYTITSTFSNFAPLEYTGLQLLAAQEFTLDLQLRPAGITVSRWSGR